MFIQTAIERVKGCFQENYLIVWSSAVIILIVFHLSKLWFSTFIFNYIVMFFFYKDLWIIRAGCGRGRDRHRESPTDGAVGFWLCKQPEPHIYMLRLDCETRPSLQTRRLVTHGEFSMQIAICPIAICLKIRILLTSDQNSAPRGYPPPEQNSAPRLLVSPCTQRYAVHSR